MNKPVLVVMAAGMGSRFGGLKQLEPIDENGHVILDYSVYDAHRAGFDTVIFVIKQEHEALFREKIGDRMSKVVEVKYAFQRSDDLPEGYYVLMNFETNPAFPAEMERVMKITDGIMRCLTPVVEG